MRRREDGGGVDGEGVVLVAVTAVSVAGGWDRT